MATCHRRKADASLVREKSKEVTRMWQGLILAMLTVLFSPPANAQSQNEIFPNDPLFKYQVSLKSPGGKVGIPKASNIAAGQYFETYKDIDLNISKAWSITTGSKTVVVAILDAGFCYQHPDIADNIWHNPGESGTDARGLQKEANEIDDDHNGFVDDVMGWDFVYNSPDVDCHIFDGMDRNRIAPYWHSLGAMGIIGAKGNNGIGVAGINWNVSMMLLRIDVQGFLPGVIDHDTPGRAARAIRYAADNGARIINWSGFVNNPQPDELQDLRSAIEYAGQKDVLIVVAAGNQRKNLDDPANCGQAPQCMEADNLVKVAEVDFAGDLSVSPRNNHFGSNYGVRTVDLAAIGMNYTTDVTRGGFPVYRLGGGTSDAAPVVSGVAALMLAVNSHLTASELKKRLIETSKGVTSLRGKIVSGGLVNAFGAVQNAKSIP